MADETERKIIHVDMDAFYASIEQRDNPDLKGKPVVVGGPPQSRGVVATASYEARKYGIHSAMPCYQAYKLCPKAIFIPPRFEAYQQASFQINQIFFQFTDLIEPLSLDEAYLDVTKNKFNNPSPTLIALEIKRLIYEKTGLTSSAGISYAKFLAKVASDYQKPNGLTVISKKKAMRFITKLPVGKIFGVGKVTEAKMNQLGIFTGGDLRMWSVDKLSDHFGKNGNFFYQISRGIDDRPVNPYRERKSIGKEHTFTKDIMNILTAENELKIIANEVGKILVRKKIKGKTITLKVRYNNFQRITRSKTIDEMTDDWNVLFFTTRELLNKTEIGKRPVRLIGISVSHLEGDVLSSSIERLKK